MEGPPSTRPQGAAQERAWLAEEVAQVFAEYEGEAVIRGTGSDQYTGMLNDAPSSQDDFDSPIRDVDEFQYVNADDDSPFAVTMDGLIGLVYKVAAQYRANASWVMNSNTPALSASSRPAQR